MANIRADASGILLLVTVKLADVGLAMARLKPETQEALGTELTRETVVERRTSAMVVNICIIGVEAN